MNKASVGDNKVLMIKGIRRLPNPDFFIVKIYQSGLVTGLFTPKTFYDNTVLMIKGYEGYLIPLLMHDAKVGFRDCIR